MKRILLIIFLILDVWAVANAQSSFVLKERYGNEVRYEVMSDGQSVRVVAREAEWPYYGKEKPKDTIELPEMVVFDGHEYPVVEVGRNAFYGCSELTCVLMPKGIRKVGTQAFNGCVGLEKIELPDGLEGIGEGAFAYCCTMSKIDIPASVTSIGISAFSMCTGLEEVVWHGDNKNLVDRTTFWGNEKLGRAAERNPEKRTTQVDKN